MVQKNDLRAIWLVRVGSYENISRVSIAVDVPMLEYHLGENAYQHICAVFSAAELRVQRVYVINLDSFDVLHENGSLGALEDIDFGNVEIIAVPHKAKVIDGHLGINHLSFEIKLLAQSFLKVIQKLVEVNAFVVVPLAQKVGHLGNLSDDEEVQLSLHSQVRVLNLQRHDLPRLSILDLVYLG